MKLKIGQLLLWYLGFYFFFNVVSDFAQTLDFEKSVAVYFKNLHFGLLLLSDIIAFGVSSVLMYLSLFYTYPKRNVFIRILFIILSLFIGISLRYFLQEVLGSVIFGKPNYHGNYSWLYYYFDNLYFISLHSIIGVVFFFFQYSKFSEKKRNELILENKKAELSFLRSQVNPHFLFNSLNNLYSLVYHQSENSLPAIEKLSNLLRFSLYDNQDEISLKKELKYIDDFIELEQMRHADPLALKMEINRSLGYLEMPPYLLIPFVENAIKHGELNDSDNPIFVSLSQEGSQLVFKVENKIKEKQKDEVGGVGLGNVKRRLELLFPSSHTLDIHTDETYFRIQLTLDLS
ncbi:MAG: sensor histidine kinase [Saprospiraceae bacterium]